LRELWAEEYKKDGMRSLSLSEMEEAKLSK
jgi:hypothetical protein